MASNTIIQSASSSHATMTYDVFVSFCGEDTRNNFTGFLFQALHRKGIRAFKDDEDIKKGESIAPELLQAIHMCRIFIVVFSKNYASSTWCLRELVEICNCIETSKRHILPIFYDVDPSEVRKQSGYYQKALAKHVERFKEDKMKVEEVQRWRETLTQVANFSGWDIRNKPQCVKIEEIVQKIINILSHKFSSLGNDGLIGMESRVEELANLLCLGSANDVRVVGISGISGIGKSTLARALYEKFSYQYDICCFIDDVSKSYRYSKALGVQKQLLSQLLNENNLKICNFSEGTCLAQNKLRNAKALIVFDNVDHVEQLKIFTGNRETLLCGCLGGGSRIIIISRDKHILRTHGVDDVYEVQPLSEENAIQLFCRKAFKGDYSTSDYEEMIHDVLSHAQGHPLAIEVLGSSLFGCNASQWRSALARLRKNKSKNIMNVLRIGFDELEDPEKEIFLDIACFFGLHNEQYVKEILDFRGFYADYGLKVLVDKSLIVISLGLIVMPNLLQDLGKCIVQEKSPKEPRKWSRLWNYQDIFKVMSDNKPAENLEGIVVYCEEDLLGTTIRVDALSKSSHLKLLLLNIFDVKFLGRLDDLSNELGYLTWYKFPFVSLPPSFQPNNLVEVFLRESNIKILWAGKKSLPNLRILDLSYSKGLLEMPNLEEALNLERLNLEGCIQLRWIDPSISLLKKLTVLNLKDCKNVVSLPSRVLILNSLEWLNLSGCSKLNIILSLDEPGDPEHLKKLCMDARLLHLFFSSVLKDSISCLLLYLASYTGLRELDLNFCNIFAIPEAIGNMLSLEILNLSGNNFVTLPSLKQLSKLIHLNLSYCKWLKYLPQLPSQTHHLLSHIYMPPRSFLHFSDERGAGLYVFNCPKLVERECYISKSSLWMKQIVQANHQYQLLRDSNFGPTIEVMVPGSDIPRWFNIQHVGSLISIDASPLMQHDKNWIGFAFCAIFVAHHERKTDLAMSPQKTKRAFPIYFPMFLNEDLVMSISDHMWLFYYTSLQLLSSCDALRPTCLGDMKLEFEIMNWEGFHFEVKKYGHRWVYEEDLKLLNSRKMRSRNSKAQKDKLSAIKENN